MHLNLEPRKQRITSAKVKKVKKPRVTAYCLIFLLALSMLSVVGMELLERGSLYVVMQWIWSYKVLFMLNVGLAFCLMVIIYAIVGSLAISGAIFTLMLGLTALINYMKLKLIGEPFFPWDILLNKESMHIASLVTGKAALIRIVAVLAAVIVALLLRWLMPRWRMPIALRACMGVFALYGLYAFGAETSMANRIVEKAGVNEIVWDQRENYMENGLILAFTLNVKNAVVKKPPTYSEHSIETVASSIEQAGLKEPAGKDPLGGKKPNVIFIMNEAFWDPTLLTNVSFSEDPLPTVHRLQKESTSGYLLSPQYGGGTSNVEFEVLTGNSMSFLPGGSIPYQQYISKPVPSLASYFADLGYKSMGIHGYEGWFWDRNTVYKQLGFESFKSSEYFENPEIKGYFISDAEMSRSIIQEVDNTEKPMFIYAVTMQNHGPYDDQRYGENNIHVEGDLTPEARTILETYTQGAYDADEGLQMLIDHFEKSDEPTLIVFYGDHLPMLGLDYQVYAESGFVHSGDAGQWSLEETKKMHSIPLVMWSNFDMPKQQIPLLSDSFLGAHVLDMLHLEKPANFALGAQVSTELPGLLSNLVADSSQKLYAQPPDETKPLLQDYRNVQYDLLFGKQYMAAYIDHDYLTKTAQSDYNAEFDARDAAQAVEGGETQAAKAGNGQ